MKRRLAALAAAMVLAGPAAAQNWGTDFNMGTFAAGGGSDRNGWLGFECAGEDSGLGTAGQPYVSLTVKQGITLNKKSLAPGISLWVGDDSSHALPMQLERDSETTLTYVYSPDTVVDVLDFIAALRTGRTFSAIIGQDHIANITLEGSAAALEYVEGCIADAQ